MERAVQMPMKPRVEDKKNKHRMLITATTTWGKSKSEMEIVNRDTFYNGDLEIYVCLVDRNSKWS